MRTGIFFPVSDHLSVSPITHRPNLVYSNQDDDDSSFRTQVAVVHVTSELTRLVS